VKLHEPLASVVVSVNASSQLEVELY